MYSKKYWYTLAEIMIVIVIIGIIFGSMNFFSAGPRISRANSERIATVVHDSIKSAQRDMLIGRSETGGLTLSAPIVKRVVSMSVGPTPYIATAYVTADGNTGAVSRMTYPFYDGDKKFQIRDISIFAVRPSAWLVTNAWTFVAFTGLTNVTVSFNEDRTVEIMSTDSEFQNAITAWLIQQSDLRYTIITTGYDKYEVKTRIDRVSGIIDASPIIVNTGTIIVPPVYTWKIDSESSCSQACWLWWTITRTVSCRDLSDQVVANTSCDQALKPELLLSCNTQACPSNGSCGLAQNQPTPTAPTVWLCSAGTGSSVGINPAVPPATQDYWIWTCQWWNGWTDASCQAPKQTNYCIAGGVVSCIVQ